MVHLEAVRDEASLWRLVASGDRTAASEVWRRDAPWLRGVLYRLLGPRHAGELDDVTQDVFIAAYQTLRRRSVEQPGRSWLLGIATNLAHDRLRRAARWDAVLRRLPLTKAHTSQVDAGLSRGMGELLVALERLTVDDRLAFVLRHVERERVPAVASALGVSEATAKRRARRGLEALRAQAAEFPHLAELLTGGLDDDAAQ